MIVSLEQAKEKIRHLFETNPHIHINVSLTRPKLSLENDPATIVNVYPHIFQIEECSTGETKRHTLQYSDLLMRNIMILELENSDT